MTAKSRFKKLEPPSTLPKRLKTALTQLDRFAHLEIGTEPIAKHKRLAQTKKLSLCLHCGQNNETEAATCWACYKPIQGTTPPRPDPEQEIQLVLDGHTYRSSDAKLPADIAELIRRIRRQGYSDALLSEWRTWRLGKASRPRISHAVEAFQGSRVSVIRLDGKLYRSDETQLPTAIQELFRYMDRYGVTPDLLSHLREHGDRVQFRPATTPLPSDGDVRFWDAVEGRTKSQRVGWSWYIAWVCLMTGAIVWIWMTFVAN